MGGCKDVSRCVYGQTPRVDWEREGEEESEEAEKREGEEVSEEEEAREGEEESEEGKKREIN